MDEAACDIDVNQGEQMGTFDSLFITRLKFMCATPRWTTGVSAPGDASKKSDPSLWSSVKCDGSASGKNATTPAEKKEGAKDGAKDTKAPAKSGAAGVATSVTGVVLGAVTGLMAL
ncbi:TPA: hypothetical protein N0F65_001258 [Lagenidium giganteum]|uniref:Uncharacterized protein n=1 Tax=Lagenidium giganteum TaxID=4803 RepID=A0AAV2YUM5_9STRA|nr:TPA: hypothetical protein N0F65_001258 [Lagenidium giganteum]